MPHELGVILGLLIRLCFLGTLVCIAIDFVRAVFFRHGSIGSPHPESSGAPSDDGEYDFESLLRADMLGRHPGNPYWPGTTDQDRSCR